MGGSSFDRIVCFTSGIANNIYIHPPVFVRGMCIIYAFFIFLLEKLNRNVYNHKCNKAFVSAWLHWINNDGVFMLNRASAAALCGSNDGDHHRSVLLFETTTFLSYTEGNAVLKGV